RLGAERTLGDDPHLFAIDETQLAQTARDIVVLAHFLHGIDDGQGSVRQIGQRHVQSSNRNCSHSTIAALPARGSRATGYQSASPPGTSVMPPMLVLLQAGAAVRLRLSRPALHNAFDAGLIAELTTALAATGTDPAIRVVVLEGAGA